MYPTYAEGGNEGNVLIGTTMYLNYAQYKGMGGTLDETTFYDLEFEAEMKINWYTFNRLKKEKPQNYPDELERCMFRLIQIAELEAKTLQLGSQSVTTTDGEGNTTTVTTSASIASQSNDGVSVSYNTINAAALFDRLSSKERGNIIETTIQRYLNGAVDSLGRKLLYRGLYPDE